jgi:hypothetical protein
LALASRHAAIRGCGGAGFAEWIKDERRQLTKEIGLEAGYRFLKFARRQQG